MSLRYKKNLRFIQKYLVEFILVLLSVFFSAWLMFSTFSYNNGSMLIATKAWSDFGSHIPLIRSFSLGYNFPPQYPIFPGEPIRYHFLYYLFVGFLEKVGIRIDWALNLPSSITFFILLLTIYFFAKSLFRSKWVGILSVVFFLFNGSFSFIEFFKSHPISTQTLQAIITNTTFPSFGPYDNKIVSAFWNLNIYTNQRHLAASISFLLIIFYYLLRLPLSNKKMTIKQAVILGLLVGAFFFFHTGVFLMIIAILACSVIVFPKIKLYAFTVILVSGIIAIPQYLYLQASHSNFHILIHPGYLIANNLTFPNFINYWFYNLGFHTVLIPIGFVLAPKTAKKIFICFFSLFIIGNVFQFTPDMPTNHKFFNVFMIFGVMLSSYTLILLWKKKIIGKCIVILFCFFLTLSGIIDVFPIYNDSKVALVDYPNNSTVAWIIKNTSPSAIFLNETFLYDPASLAGRKIFLGWPYFSWSAGYDTNARGKLMHEILTNTDKQIVCALLLQNKIEYIEIEKKIGIDPNYPTVSNLFQQTFTLAYQNPTKEFAIYNVKNSCL